MSFSKIPILSSSKDLALQFFIKDIQFHVLFCCVVFSYTLFLVLATTKVDSSPLVSFSMKLSFSKIWSSEGRRSNNLFFYVPLA